MTAGDGRSKLISIVTPVFLDGEIVAFMAAVAHVADINGRLDYFDARDLYEELGLNGDVTGVKGGASRWCGRCVDCRASSSPVS